MEGPAPISTPITNESNLLNFQLQYNYNNIDFSLIDINNSKLKLTAKSQNNKGIYKNYSIEISLDDLKKKNKYFKMFDNYQEFMNNFIDLCKAKNIKVINIENGELVITIDLLIISENLLKLSLKESELNQKEQIEFLLKDSKDKDKKILELDHKIQIMEKTINELINRIEILEKNREINQTSLVKNINYNKDVNEKLCKETYIKSLGSKILLNQNEFEFLSKAISDKNNIFLELLYSSSIKGENKDELIKAYIGKNDLLFLIKTSTNKRFGGYSHETFELNKFKKIDKKAFLFNIDNLEIYKSKGTNCSIMKNDLTKNSINFGGGTDLRIFHNFFSEQNYTSPNGDRYYDYKDKEYALNGEKYFKISIFELYRVIIQ